MARAGKIRLLHTPRGRRNFAQSVTDFLGLYKAAGRAAALSDMAADWEKFMQAVFRRERESMGHPSWVPPVQKEFQPSCTLKEALEYTSMYTRRTRLVVPPPPPPLLSTQAWPRAHGSWDPVCAHAAKRAGDKIYGTTIPTVMYYDQHSCADPPTAALDIFWTKADTFFLVSYRAIFDFTLLEWSGTSSIQLNSTRAHYHSVASTARRSIVRPPSHTTSTTRSCKRRAGVAIRAQTRRSLPWIRSARGIDEDFLCCILAEEYLQPIVLA